MATIDNLNFKVILDDKDFTARVKADLKAAQELNTQLSNLLAVKQKYSQISASDAASAKRALAIQEAQAKAAATQAAAQQKVRQAAEQTALAHQKVLTEQNRTAEAAARAAAAQQRAQNAAERTRTALSGQGKVMRELAAMAGTYFSVMGVTRFLGSIVRVTGEFETQRLALRNIVQDINGADALFDKLKALAIQSPFTFSELGSYAKQLSAFSIPLDELYDTTKMLADVSAGLGVDMGRLILAYGQVRSASFLRGQEVRQFTEAGVPLLTELAKQFERLNGQATTAGDVFDKISKRLVPFEMVKQVMVDLTSEGGKFFEMQSVLSETLKGKVMKLKDAWEQMLYAIGESNSGVLHGVMDTALDYVKNYEKLGSLLGGLVATWGVYKVAVIAAGVAQARMNGTVTAGMAAMKSIGNFIKANPWAVLAAAVTACAAGVHLLVTAESDLERMQNAVSDAIGECVAKTESEVSKLNALRNVMEKAGEGTEAYGAAKKILLKDFGTYFTDLDRENLKVGNLAAVYDRLAESVRNSTKERFYSKATEGLENKYKEATENIIKQLEKEMDKLGLDSGQRVQMTMYVSGQVDAGQLDSALQRYIERGESVMALAGQGEWTTVLPAVAELVALREQYAKTRETFDTETARILATFGKLTRGSSTTQSLGLTQWQKDVNAVLEEVYGEAAKTSELYIKEGTVDFTNYVDTIRKKYAELGASLANASTTGYEDESVAQWKNDMKGIEAVARKLGKTLKEVKKEEGGTKSTGLSDALKREKESIETQINQLRRLKKAYEDLASYLPESLVGEAMRGLFPDMDSSLKDADDCGAAIRRLAEDLKKIPGSEKSAESVLSSLVGDMDEPLKKAVKAGDEFAAAIQERLTKAFDTEGTDVGYKVSEIFRKLREQNAKTDKEYSGLKAEYETAASSELALKALRIKYGEEFWNKYLKDGVSALDSLQAEEKEYYRKKAQEQVNALAGAYVSTKVGDGKGVDIGGLSDKSLRQVKNLKKDVQALLDGVDMDGLGLSDGTVESLKAAGITLEDFYASVKALLQVDIDKLSDEIKEKLYKAVQTAAKGVSGLGQSLEQLGEAAENPAIADLGTMLKGAGNAIANIASGISSGNIGGAAIAAATELLNGLTEALVNEAAETREAEKNAADYANAVAMLKLELSDLYDTVWGTDTFGKLGDAFTKSAAAAKAYSEALTELNEKYDGQSYDFYGAGEGGGTLSKIFGAASRSAYDLNEALEGLQRMQVLTNDRNWFQQWLGFADEYTALGNLAPDLWEGGEFNVENAKKFLETNTQISDEQRAELQNLVNLKEQYDKIQDSVDDMVESLVGSLASDVVDSFLESFKETGDAVADLDDAFSNLGETIVSSLMQSTLVDTILNKYTPKLKDLVASYSTGGTSAIDMVSKVSEIADGIKSDIVNSADVWNTLLEVLDENGLLGSAGSTSSSSGSLSEGIKSITEDTANLLASYVNAIRADVSTGREQRAEILEILRTAFAASPSISEYLMQIQANTYNTAVATQGLLTEFRGVLAPHSEGGNGVKVVAE